MKHPIIRKVFVCLLNTGLAVTLFLVGFKTGMIVAQRNQFAVTLIQFSYQVGFRDGMSRSLAMDKHDADRVLPGSTETE